MGTDTDEKHVIYLSTPWGEADDEETSDYLFESMMLMVGLTGILADAGKIAYPARLYSRVNCTDNYFHILRSNMKQATEAWVYSPESLSPIVMYDIMLAGMLQVPVRFLKDTDVIFGVSDRLEVWDDMLHPQDFVHEDYARYFEAFKTVFTEKTEGQQHVTDFELYRSYVDAYELAYGHKWFFFEGVFPPEDEYTENRRGFKLVKPSFMN